MTSPQFTLEIVSCECLLGSLPHDLHPLGRHPGPKFVQRLSVFERVLARRQKGFAILQLPQADTGDLGRNRFILLVRDLDVATSQGLEILLLDRLAQLGVKLLLENREQLVMARRRRGDRGLAFFLNSQRRRRLQSV